MKKPPKRLIRTYTGMDTNTLEDIIYVAALNVEDALLTGGARPGVDYTLLQVYDLAMPIAMRLWERNKHATHVTTYPADHPGAST